MTNSLSSHSTPMSEVRLTEPELESISAVAQTPAYTNNPVPDDLRSKLQEQFERFAFVPFQQRSSLAAIYQCSSQDKALDCLQADWAAALNAGALRLFDARRSVVSFPLRMLGPNGKPIEVGIAKSTQSNATHPWYLSYVPMGVRSHRVGEGPTASYGAIAASGMADASGLNDGGSAAAVSPSAPGVTHAAPHSASSTMSAHAAAGTASSTASSPITFIPTQMTAALDAMRTRENYLSAPVPAETREQMQQLTKSEAPFGTDIWIMDKWRERLQELAQPLAESASEKLDVAGLLDRDFRYCVEHGIMRAYGDKTLFPVSICRRDGQTPIEVSLKPDTRRVDVAVHGNVAPWVVWGVDDYVPRGNAQGKALEEWAYLGRWDDLLTQLDEMALQESWDFEEEGAQASKSILRSYLKYTFYRLKQEEKVLQNFDEGFAAFNTGLVTRTYESIFACFEPNSPQDAAVGEGVNGGDAQGAVRRSQYWRFAGFCKVGSRRLGKRLVATFNPLPARAQYFADKDDLLYDCSRELIVDRDHILIDNIDRLPIQFLEEEMRGFDEAEDALERIKQIDPAQQHELLYELYGELRHVLRNEPRLQRRLINRFQDEVDLAVKRVEWNYRTAIPSFYPTHDSVSLLLPIDLTEDSRPDIALVVELTESGAYLGQTILTMRMAYNNARLVCRPDSDWLNTSVRLVDDGLDEE